MPRDSEGNELELRRLCGGGSGWFRVTTPKAPPTEGCGCIACKEREEELRPLPANVPPKVRRLLGG